MSLLPGWNPGPAGSFVVKADSATSTATTITAPSGIQTNDFIILLDRATNLSSMPLTAVPSGFTSIVNTTNTTTVRQLASYKLADGTEGGTSITGMSGDLGAVKVMFVFRGNPAITSANISTPNAEGTDGNPAAQSVTASGATAPVIVFGCYGSDAAIATRSFTPAKNDELSSTTAVAVLWLAFRIDNNLGQDTTIDMDDTGNANILQSFYAELSQ